MTETGADSVQPRHFTLRRFWRKRSVSITECDPSFKVVYLGNVLTGWAKGEGCVEKPLATLWKNYVNSRGQADIRMKLTVSQSGLKAVTKEHGLTEYWNNRITHCQVHEGYPRVFSWVYRHEGRKLKQELRCHAVLCCRADKASTLNEALQTRLSSALQEFRREKMSRQKARLSLVNCIVENPSSVLPRRKLLLSTGMHNYRPPLERSKSAPRLMSIEEDLFETLEDEEEEEGLPSAGPVSPDEGEEVETETNSSVVSESSDVVADFDSAGTSSMDDDEEEEEVDRRRPLPLPRPDSFKKKPEDTISDESGYSEEKELHLRSRI